MDLISLVTGGLMTFLAGFVTNYCNRRWQHEDKKEDRRWQVEDKERELSIKKGRRNISKAVRNY